MSEYILKFSSTVDMDKYDIAEMKWLMRDFSGDPTIDIEIIKEGNENE